VTLLWSLIALVQVTFLPGYLIARWLRLDDGLAKTWTISFGLSLIANYHVTLLLSLLGLQARAWLCAVIAIEILALFRLQQSRPARGPAEPAAVRVTRFLIPSNTADPHAVSGGRLLLLLLGIASLAWIAMFLPAAFTSIFEGYDALVSWNRWALDWTNGQLPVWTLRYPQLLPANWAMLYTLAGVPLQFLPKGLSVLFPLTTVGMFIDAGLRRSRPEYLLAAVLTAALMSFSNGRYIASGYADLPVAFFALAPFYLLASWNDDGDRARGRATIAVATAFVIGCALTKQAGLYLALLFPFLLYAFLHKHMPTANSAERLRIIAGVTAALLLLIAPWYVFKQIQVIQGFDVPGNASSSGVHRGRSFPERAARAWKSWELHLSSPLLWSVALGVALSAFTRRTAAITVAITLPFTLIWVLFFSYDQRNLALAFPFIGLSAATGAMVAGDWFRAQWQRCPRAAHRGGAAALLAAIVLTFGVMESGRIAALHDRALRDLGNDEINAFLYSYLEHHGFEGRILTNYRLLSSLPDLAEYVYLDRDAPASEFWPLRNPDSLKSVLKRERGDIRYIVVLKPMKLPVMAILHDGIRKGELQVLYRTRRALVLRLRSTPEP
jgi:hypothetical protein